MAISECGAADLDETAREKKEHGKYDFPAAIYEEDLEITEVPWHWHTEAELIRVVGGEGIFSCSGNSIILEAGQGIFFNGGRLHSCRVVPGGHCRIRSVVFRPEFVSGGRDTVLWSRYLQPLTENKNLDHCCLIGKEPWEKETLELIDAAWRSIREEAEGFEFSARNALSDIILRLYRYMPPSADGKAGAELRKIDRVKTMMEFIQTGYAEDMRTSDIAASASVSESECQRCFKSVLHTTPVRYLLGVRLRKACELLETTELSAAKVSELSGFQDNSYFGKLFKKKYGLTPAAYRAARQAEQKGYDHHAHQ